MQEREEEQLAIPEVVPPPEEKPETKPDPLETLRKEFEQERTKWGEAQRKLSARLTQEQQTNSEYRKWIDRDIIRRNKERDNGSESEVAGPVYPPVPMIPQELSKIKYDIARGELARTHPDWEKYRNRMSELVNEGFAEMQFSPEGMESLYKMAKFDDLHKEIEELKSTHKAEAEKERAFTEGGSPRTSPNSKPKLSPEERRAAMNLGIKEEDYVRRRDE